ncbi:MAG: hypothetical protein KC442_23555 [Thermomicrobiales bacterium]|nr:hypothetical protein [Thermomicrobiales bacterium]MCA9880802.1 hypothetical protein [Thermomicrobiales bacterium]
MVFEAFSQLGLPASHLASVSVEPWLVLLTCAIVWLALSGEHSTRRGAGIPRA